MRVIHLHGALGQRFGSRFDLDVSSAAEAVRALSVNLPGFREALAEGHWRIVTKSGDKGADLGEDELTFSLGRGELHIIPAIAGAGRGGLGKVLAGIAIIAIAWYAAPVVGGMSATAFGSVTYGNIAAIGVSMALSGVAQMMAPTPKSSYGDRNAADQRPSFLFNGAVNVSEQGGPVALAYGRCMVGSTVISAGIATEKM